LRERLRRSLPAYMVPAAWVVLPELPLNPNGKIDRLALPAPEAAASPFAVPPRDDLERRLAAIWEEVLGTGPVGVTDDFFDLGGHSLLAVRLMARVEAELGRALPLSALFQSGTVAGLAAGLREEEPAGSPLVLLQPRGSRPPLFLVHPAGGEALCYSGLVRRLGTDQPVYGFEDTAEAARSVSALAAAYVAEVLAVQPEGPYRLAGWSFGGRVAFEMARQLTSHGRAVAFLGMIDTGQAVPDEEVDLSETGLLREILRGASREILDGLPPGLDDPLGEVLERLRAAGQIPEGFDPATTRRLWQVFRRHVEMARRERPLPWTGRLVYYAAEEGLAADPTQGWAALAASVEVRRVPGDHVSMIYDEANLEVLARHLRAGLDASGSGLANPATR
ncbi:MAG TPA: thioesterase domain-containing protein, partial [Thermoanaerobaculia bacterium]|nr:thioesterase domain-containing protein [Thermoanaerobaculia bacterium]